MGWLSGFQAKRSGDIAKARLKLLLVSDKAGCSPEMIRMIKNDMIFVISKYMEIEKDKVLIRMDTPGGLEGADRPPTMLCANIPIRSIPNKGLY